MKVVQILGSPRAKGPSTRIANSFTKEAEKNGADVTSYTLNKMNYQGCQSCYACKGKIEECAVQDSLTETLRDIKDADIAVFATPVYFWDVSGQFKLMVDRFFSFFKPDFYTNPKPGRIASGKTAILIITKGGGDDKHEDVSQKYTTFLKMAGFERIELIWAVNMSLEVDVDAGKYEARMLDLAKELTA